MFLDVVEHAVEVMGTTEAHVILFGLTQPTNSACTWI